MTAKNTSPVQIQLREHETTMNAKKVSAPVLVQGTVVDLSSVNYSTAAVEVTPGSLMRIRIAAATAYIAFSDDSTLGAVSSSTTPGLELEVGTHLVRATAKFMRASANPARVEIIEDV